LGKHRGGTNIGNANIYTVVEAVKGEETTVAARERGGSPATKIIAGSSGDTVRPPSDDGKQHTSGFPRGGRRNAARGGDEAYNPKMLSEDALNLIANGLLGEVQICFLKSDSPNIVGFQRDAQLMQGSKPVVGGKPVDVIAPDPKKPMIGEERMTTLEVGSRSERRRKRVGCKRRSRRGFGRAGGEGIAEERAPVGVQY
jgi:hypothetical protein